MAKLTLSVDTRVVARAKRYAKAQGTSVSGLVERLLDLAAGPVSREQTVPPVLARVRGSLARGGKRDYRRYLEQKYR